MPLLSSTNICVKVNRRPCEPTLYLYINVFFLSYSTSQCCTLSNLHASPLNSPALPHLPSLPPVSNPLPLQQQQQQQGQQPESLSSRYLDGSDLLTADLLDSVDACFEPSTRTDTVWYTVEFKSRRTDTYYCPAQPSIPLHSWVVVEADRGQDIGRVIVLNVSLAQIQSMSTHTRESPKRLYRIATCLEISVLDSKQQDEEKALEICQAKCHKRRLSMQIVNAEYQWDRRKLTFYFIADKRVDFRELVRDLFKLYKTRIWM
ncbi:PSP1 C-terminal conserved region-domain-containing protein [Spinellus fusiger]|nr:PSP1 C-terminal conserved region-domain-containing protein [Spinellus fusiger]